MLKQFFTYNQSVQFYRECETLRVPSHLRDQLLRAASSIVLNVAEGYGKPTIKDKARFHGIALGSLRECQAIIDLVAPSNIRLAKLADRLGGQLYVLSHRPKPVPA